MQCALTLTEIYFKIQHIYLWDMICQLISSLCMVLNCAISPSANTLLLSLPGQRVLNTYSRAGICFFFFVLNTM